MEKVINYWKNSNVKINDGVSLNQIKILEQTINFEFPLSFIKFYTKINGFKDRDWNENMFTIYPLKIIEEEYIYSNNENFIPFCDFLINSHQIGFHRTDKKIYINYPSIKDYDFLRVSDTFEQSMIEIINDSDKIYGN